MKRDKNKIISPMFLVLAALIWGISFVAQSEGGHIGTFTFMSIRSLLASITLYIYIIVSGAVQKKKSLKNNTVIEADDKKVLWKCGLLCGTVLFVACNIQQMGIDMEGTGTSVGRAGFLTAIYIILVPIFGIFLKKKISPLVWFSVLAALFGLYMLAVPKGESFTGFSKADTLVLLCAPCFALHITVCDICAAKADPIKISCIQFLICGVLSCIAAVIFEKPDMSEILKMYIPLLYSGILSGGGAFTFQLIGQKHTPPTLAAMLMSLESVFATLADWVIRHNSLSSRELIGCAVVFAAIIFAQIPTENLFKKKAKE